MYYNYLWWGLALFFFLNKSRTIWKYFYRFLSLFRWLHRIIPQICRYFLKVKAYIDELSLWSLRQKIKKDKANEIVLTRCLPSSIPVAIVGPNEIQILNEYKNLTWLFQNVNIKLESFLNLCTILLKLCVKPKYRKLAPFNELSATAFLYSRASFYS